MSEFQQLNVTCEDCPFFFDGQSEDGSGYCRVNPPTVAVDRQGSYASSPFGEWPIVSETDWCGRHPEIQTRVQLAMQVGAQQILSSTQSRIATP